MARSFLTPINLNQNELQNSVLQNLGTPPSSPKAGQIYYDTTALFPLVWNGTAWINSLARANHTGTQLAATISNLASTVQAYSLSLFAIPTGNLSMGGYLITNLATPTATGQAATYDWVRGLSISTFGTATSVINMGGYQITNLATNQTATGQAASWDWVTARNLNSIVGTAPTTANWANAGYKIQNIGTPSIAGDAATYDWTLARPLNTFATPTGNVALGGYQITGLNTVQTTSGQAASYDFVISQVQSAAAGIASKPPVMCVASTNITLSGLQTIDGYTTLANDRVLVAGQTTTTANGVYNAASSAWVRVTDDGSAPGEIEGGAMWLSVNGTVYGGSQWRCSTTGTITIGTTAITIVQFGAASLYAAGNGITLTGTTFSANVLAAGGILVSGSGLSLDTTVAARKYSVAIGDGSTLSYIVTHNLGTQNIMMQVKMSTTPYSEVECDQAATSNTTATFTFTVAPTSGQYIVTIVG